MKCPKCRRQTTGDEHFCSKCGADLSALRAVCPNCGSKMPDGAKFCTRCGQGLDQKVKAPSRERRKGPRKSRIVLVLLIPILIIAVIAIAAHFLGITGISGFHIEDVETTWVFCEDVTPTGMFKYSHPCYEKGDDYYYLANVKFEVVNTGITDRCVDKVEAFIDGEKILTELYFCFDGIGFGDSKIYEFQPELLGMLGVKYSGNDPGPKRLRIVITTLNKDGDLITTYSKSVTPKR